MAHENVTDDELAELIQRTAEAASALIRGDIRTYSKSTMVVKSCQKVYISHMSKPAMDKRNRYADT